MIYDFTARSSPLAAGTNKCLEQFQMFGVPREQPFRVELDAQQIRQSADSRRCQFQALYYTISADRGGAQTFCHPGHGLMVRTVHTQPAPARQRSHQRTGLAGSVVDDAVLSVCAAMVHGPRYLLTNIGKESAP